ncbi:hypothetical protein MNBD_PLANCTO03-1039 [hydrothermal vent metagenome]|uniref:Prepilin-type N-terminal cleavage/methylation domain-containing protein n=1 Tax=hydrothermal vent metagenome TaxID=652676 RepID=A0A3B1D9M4_9ZZZZ
MNHALPKTISRRRQCGGRLARHGDGAHSAFTLTELIVVISIILILLAVSLPTFRATIASTESSNAETKLRLALLTGRNAALHSDRGADTAVVFFYEPGGRASAIICEYVGSFTDLSDTANPVDRDIFVPVPAFEPIQLPQGWMVRGFVPAGMMDLGSRSNRPWYDKTAAGSGDPYDPAQRNWVFPETGFYDALAIDDGEDRQSFMIRFNGGIGSVALGDTREALVLSPRPTAAGRTTNPYNTFRVDIGANTAAVVRKALLRFESGGLFGGGMDPLTRLFGDISGDTVLCRTVEQVVLYSAPDLAAAIGTKLDRDTGCFYKMLKGKNNEPRYGIRNTFFDKIPLWLEGDTNFNGEFDPYAEENPDLPAARIYTFQRYTGALQPVPLLDLDGVPLSGGAR